MSTTTVSFRISTRIKDSVKPILEANGMTLSELCQNVLIYIAETGRLTIKKVLVSKEDEIARAWKNPLPTRGLVKSIQIECNNEQKSHLVGLFRGMNLSIETIERVQIPKAVIRGQL